MSKAKAKTPGDDYPAFPTPKPVSNADRRWFEKRIGQMRLPGFEEKSPPPSFEERRYR